MRPVAIRTGPALAVAAPAAFTFRKGIAHPEDYAVSGIRAAPPGISHPR
jgi:hypothetical protein